MVFIDGAEMYYGTSVRPCDGDDDDAGDGAGFSYGSLALAPLGIASFTSVRESKASRGSGQAHGLILGNEE